VLSQLVREGTPFIATATQHSILDMRTLISSYAEAERGVSQAMARYYGLPRLALGGASEAKLVDQQAAAEASLTLLVETLGGGNLIHDMGYLESGLSFSLAQLVICDEIVSWIKGYVKPIEITDETLALDLIAQYRDEGPYLESEHTIRHYRDRWYPALFERVGYDAWRKRGGLSLGERASARVDQLLEEHQVEPLPEQIAARIRAIVMRTEQHASKSGK
jgi:trimethylamine--corrinoid protein Co-methyltransferase